MRILFIVCCRFSDVLPVKAALKANSFYSLVGLFQGLVQIPAQCGDPQYPAAVGEEPAVLQRGPPMEHRDTQGLAHFIQAGNLLALGIAARVPAAGQNHAGGGLL